MGIVSEAWKGLRAMDAERVYEIVRFDIKNGKDLRSVVEFGPESAIRESLLKTAQVFGMRPTESKSKPRYKTGFTCSDPSGRMFGYYLRARKEKELC